MMRLQVDLFNERNNPELAEFVRSRLDRSVGKFHERLRRISVRLSDQNSDKGGEDKTCKIEAAFIPKGRIFVHATDTDIRQAVQKAIHRLRDFVAKSIERSHRGEAVRHRSGGMREANRAYVEQV